MAFVVFSLSTDPFRQGLEVGIGRSLWNSAVPVLLAILRQLEVVFLPLQKPALVLRLFLFHYRSFKSDIRGCQIEVLQKGLYLSFRHQIEDRIENRNWEEVEAVYRYATT